MKYKLMLLCALIGFNLSAQKITLDNIWGWKYYANSLSGIASMNDGEHYTVLDPQGITKHSYQSFVSGNKSDEIVLAGKFEDYQFSSDEKYILVLNDGIPIYRRSLKGKWRVYDREKKSFQAIFDGKLVQEPTFSPDGTKVAFVFENNLYYQDLSNQKVVQITEDGKQNEIINGINDWVYEEEFGFVRQFEWNADGTVIAFVKFDESQVKEFFIPIYNGQLYPDEMRFKYPKAGEVNATVSLHIYNLNTNQTSLVNLNSVENYYIPKIKFTNDKNVLAVLTSNRHQNKVDLSWVEIPSLKVTKAFTETDQAWIETDNFTLEFLDDNSFLWTSERDGNKHIYHYDKSGKLKNQVTKGDWEVLKFYGYNPKDKTVYFQANVFDGKRISTEKHIYKANLNGSKLTRLSAKNGTNSADFSKNFNYYIQNFSSINQPNLITLNDGQKPNEYGVIVQNDEVKRRMDIDDFGTKELMTIKTDNGLDLNAWIIKPKDFDPNKKYPVLMYQYSGPGSQEVTNSWHDLNDQWHFMLAQNGYLVICVDGRGTGGKGAAFKKQTYMDLGKLEVEDQIAAAKAIAKFDYVDGNRIGIWGWSYGGYMSSNCIFRAGDVFKMGIAVAPVTNWRYYDTVYTERFMRMPQENPNGYDRNSPITYASQFDDKKDKFLLIHGSADDNVHMQNAMDLAEALIQANKQFDMMIYPDKNHGIYGGKTRLQLYNLMTNYIQNNL